MCRALVTGGTGYIGSKLVKKLIEKEWEVGIITRESSDFSYLEEVKGHYNTYYLNLNMENLEDIIYEFKPEIVFHLAAYVVSDNDEKDIEKLVNSNIYFGTKLLQELKKSEVKYFVNTGTYWQNYNNEDYNPVNLYAATKEAFEKIIKYYVETSNLKAITLKLFDVYGPNDKRNKLISSLDKFVDSSKNLQLSGGNQLIDFIYIDDVIEAYIASYYHLKDVKSKYMVYGVASGKRQTLRDAVAICEEVLGSTLNITFGGKPYREREVMVPWYNYVKLPNWEPRTNLEQGLYECYKNSTFIREVY